MKTRITLSLCITLFISVLLSCNSTTKENKDPNASADSYTSKMTKSDKKKYYDANNNVVYEIKYKSDGFKLRTASSDLLWKVKFYDAKVKISDNEENLNPFEIKKTDSHKAKLVKDETTLARTSYDVETKQQSIASEGDAQPEFIETTYSPSLLVNKIPGIAKDQKQILIEELKGKGY